LRLSCQFAFRLGGPIFPKHRKKGGGGPAGGRARGNWGQQMGSKRLFPRWISGGLGIKGYAFPRGQKLSCGPHGAKGGGPRGPGGKTGVSPAFVSAGDFVETHVGCLGFLDQKRGAPLSFYWGGSFQWGGPLRGALGLGGRGGGDLCGRCGIGSATVGLAYRGGWGFGWEYILVLNTKGLKGEIFSFPKRIFQNVKKKNDWKGPPGNKTHPKTGLWSTPKKGPHGLAARVFLLAEGQKPGGTGGLWEGGRRVRGGGVGVGGGLSRPGPGQILLGRPYPSK